MSDPQTDPARIDPAEFAQVAARFGRLDDPDPPLALNRWRPPDVPARYRAHLDDLEQTAAVTLAREWLDGVRLDPDEDRGLTIVGAVGRGKSAIAGALALDAGAPQFASFWPVLDLLDALRAEVRSPYGDELPVREKIARRRVLVLDDVGAERPTEWSEGALAGIISATYEARRLLVLTTNLAPTQLADHLGARAVSRLDEMTVTLTVDGPDRRRRA